MSPDSKTKSSTAADRPPEGIRRGGWRLPVIGLVLLLGGFVLFLIVRGFDPVGRAVNRIMDTVRLQEASAPFWWRGLEALRAWLGGPGAASARDSDPGDELAKLGEPAHPFLLDLAKDDRSAGVRTLAIRVLSEGGATNAWPMLVSILEADPDVDLRAAAAEGLAQLDPVAAEPRLLAALPREARFVAQPEAGIPAPWRRTRALEAIARAVGTVQSTNAVPALLDVLAKVPAPEVESCLANALGVLEDMRAAPALRQLLNSTNKAVRFAAVQALGQLQDREAAPALMALISGVLTNDATLPARAGPAGWPGPAPGTPGSAPMPPGGAGDHRSDLLVLAGALGTIGDQRATPLLLQALTNMVEDHELTQFIEAFTSLRDPRAVPALKALLTARPAVARQAADALVTLGQNSLVAELTSLLHSFERDKRIAAATALAYIGDKTVLTNLLGEWAGGASSDRRLQVAEALGVIGDASAVPALAEALQDPEEDLRTQAVWSLGHVGDPAGVPWLLQALGDTNFSVRFAAAFSLVGLTNQALMPALQKLLADPEPRVSTAAACSLAFHGSDGVLPQLSIAARHRDDWQRFAAATLFLRLNTAESRQRLAKMSGDQNKYLQDYVRAGLAHGPGPALTNLLRRGSADFRHYAARMLLFFEDPAALPALRDALQDSRAEVRVAARIAIRRLERGRDPGR